MEMNVEENLGSIIHELDTRKYLDHLLTLSRGVLYKGLFNKELTT